MQILRMENIFSPEPVAFPARLNCTKNAVFSKRIYNFTIYIRAIIRLLEVYLLKPR